MDISFFTSDDSVFDDFWDSEQVTSKFKENIDERGHQLQETELNQNTVQSNSNVSIVKDELISDASNNMTMVNIHDDIVKDPNEENQYNNNCKTNQLLLLKEQTYTNDSTAANTTEPPINPKDVDDNDLIEALFLCEQNYNKTKTLMQSTQEYSSPGPSHRPTYDSDPREYEHLQHYLKVVTTKSQPIHSTGLSSGIRDYASENPYGKLALDEGKNRKKLMISRRPVLKRLKNNNIRLHRYHLLHKLFVQRRTSHLDLYNDFTKKFPLDEGKTYTRRIISKHGIKYTAKKPTKWNTTTTRHSSQTRDSPFPLLSVSRSKSSWRKIQHMRKRKTSQYHFKLIKPKVTYSLYVIRDKQQEILAPKSKNQHKSKPVACNVSSQKREILCNPYIKADPDFKGPTCQPKNNGNHFII